MSKRIAMIAYTHYESDPRVRREAETLAARGDDVTVWCLQSDGAEATSQLEGVEIRRISIPRYRGGKALAYVGSYLQFFIVSAARLSREHHTAPFDIVHIHTMPDFMVFTAFWPRLRGAKVILDMHDLMPDLYAVKFGLSKQGKAVEALRMVQKTATAFADAVICVHEPQYELLLRDGVPTHKLAIVMNAADPKLFPPRDSQPAYGEEDQIRVIYHGTILHRYGVDLGIRAFAKARAQDSRLVMSVLGDGDFLPEVKRIAEELNLPDDVLHFSNGRLPLSEVAEAIRTSHIGIIPNRDDQEDSVLPTKLLEYVSVGIPAVAPRTRCISRYFDESQVEMVPVEDIDAMAGAILRIANDESRRKEMIEAARTWQDTYGFDVQMRFLCRTVDHLCRS
ncbi:MAG: glycosyltransferase family 4 protein [Myxococcota bacterium]|nr:glycosyltransferase family 4 protein [Myxococcota bacterium]